MKFDSQSDLLIKQIKWVKWLLLGLIIVEIAVIIIGYK